ncbi:MAG TPA: hypothetical protein VGM56_06680 [Byssovorax sp.]
MRAELRDHRRDGAEVERSGRYVERADQRRDDRIVMRPRFVLRRGIEGLRARFVDVGGVDLPL